MIGISKKGMSVLNSFALDTLTRLNHESAILCNYSGRVTLTDHDVESAIKLVCYYCSISIDFVTYHV